MTRMLELSDQCQTAKGFNGEIRQPARTDGQCKQRDRKPKNQKEMLVIKNPNRNEGCL